jgi:hypothetical protein
LADSEASIFLLKNQTEAYWLLQWIERGEKREGKLASVLQSYFSAPIVYFVQKSKSELSIFLI